jgi:hypothetical protein
VVPALGAHLEIVLQAFPPDDLAAVDALLPKTFGADVFLALFRF